MAMFKGWTEESIEALLQKRRQPLRDLERQMERAPVPAAVSSTQANATGAQTKYRNRKVTDAEGNVHDSTKEFRRWEELQLREIAGEIQQLRHHVPYACVVEGEHICDYEADFTYRDGAALIVEDVKPKDPKFRKTAAYRLFRVKQKLAQALHKFQIREI